jgi:hypothetical protein
MWEPSLSPEVTDLVGLGKSLGTQPNFVGGVGPGLFSARTTTSRSLRFARQCCRLEAPHRLNPRLRTPLTDSQTLTELEHLDLAATVAGLQPTIQADNPRGLLEALEPFLSEVMLASV